MNILVNILGPHYTKVENRRYRQHIIRQISLKLVIIFSGLEPIQYLLRAENTVLVACTMLIIIIKYAVVDYEVVLYSTFVWKSLRASYLRIALYYYYWTICLHASVMLMHMLLCCVIVVFCICTMVVANSAKTKNGQPLER